MINIIRKFNNLLSKKQKRKLLFIGLISIVGAFLEVLGVSLVLPLTAALMDPDIMETNPFIAAICSAIGLQTHKSFVLLCIISLIFVFLIKNIYLLFEYYTRAQFVYDSRLTTQRQLFHAVLSRPYEYFLSSASGEIIRNLYADIVETYRILMTLLSFMAESIVSLALIITVFVIAPLMTAIILAFIALLVIVIIKVIKPKLRVKGDELRKHTALSYKWVLQGIHGIKDIKIAQQEEYFEDRFFESSKVATSSVKWQSIFNNVPRLLIESGCICSALFAVAIWIYSGNPMEELIPILATFAMAAVKLMPSANRIVNAANDIIYSGPSIDKVLNGLNYHNEGKCNCTHECNQISLTKDIVLENITYCYPGTNTKILDGASLVIPAGSCVGLIGKSGAGKTTIVDILLGLLTPQSGNIFSDGKNIMSDYCGWLSHIGYIPQSIFILDGTLAENVAFGNEIDVDRMWQALEDAQLSDYVKSLPDGINTKVGERGIRVSGGQLQRIGIARALYKNPALLIFDEATSSLDNATESAIMESINRLHGKKTIIIIAHRSRTTKNCDIIFEVNGKKISKKSERKTHYLN